MGGFGSDVFEEGLVMQIEDWEIIGGVILWGSVDLNIFDEV